ncbi:MAG TPA: lactate utilization protein B, partial [Fimbriimonadaceae bacterium]|nr:lactate utilization protein B [Fimbriimonadaceae bacterium]
MRLPKVERFARELEPEVSLAVRYASATKTSARRLALDGAFADPEEARRQAADVKAYVLDNLKALLLQFEEQATARGVKVHWAADADAARRIVLELCKGAGHGAIIAKGKSMATEEIHLNAALEEAGYKPVETDLGEYVVQLDHDAPSHIVTPIIHKSRLDIARSFHREGLGPYTEEPGELTMQARAHLRSMFRQAEVGISGVNFAIAETGRIVIVENEGNNRFSTTAPRIHIALMGIEKLLPSEAHLGLFLRLLVGSATGQRAPVYTHLIDGPRRPDEPDGPDEVHVVLLDNGRSRILEGPYRDILRCIRCGACLNVCPVYREVSGHAYRHVYPGPLGAVLAPALDGVAEMGDLAKASTLCGACEEVCPVKIPIPDLLLRLRAEAAGTGQDDAAPWGLYGAIARDPTRWRAGLKLLPMALKIPNPHVS